MGSTNSSSLSNSTNLIPPNTSISSKSSKPSKPARKSQRYENSTRLIAGCVPILKSNDNNIISYSICMIHSNNKKDFIFPKGGWEENETKEEAAKREAYEEAGVVGNKTVYLGEFDFESEKGNKCKMYAHLLVVDTILEDYPEKDRLRKWVTIEEARVLTTRPKMAIMLNKALDNLDYI